GLLRLRPAPASRPGGRPLRRRAAQDQRRDHGARAADRARRRLRHGLPVVGHRHAPRLHDEPDEQQVRRYLPARERGERQRIAHADAADPLPTVCFDEPVRHGQHGVRVRPLRRARAQVMIIFAAALPALIGFLGLALDGGYYMAVGETAQYAAAAAARAAAMDVMTGAYTSATSDGATIGQRNLSTLQLSGVNVTIQYNDTSSARPRATGVA